jgi:Phosphate starvation-inducible protein PhoH, predicted ATPase
LPPDSSHPLDHESGGPRVVDVDDVAMIRVLGVHDRVLGQVEKQFPDVTIHARGNRITIEGAPDRADEAMRLVEQLIELARSGVELDVTEVTQAARIHEETEAGATDVLAQPILSRQGRTVRPKTLGQKNYVDSIDRNTIVFGIGPAGTGKTYPGDGQSSRGA